MAADQAAINKLTRCLQDMGKLGSNPVLEILRGTDKFIQGKKFPDGNLQFSGIGLQAYYHNHAKPYLRPNEHGHFHIFYSDDASLSLDQWRHLVALSIDSDGQPRSWFCVNQWVTGGQWLQAKDAGPALQQVFSRETSSLIMVEKWIVSMLDIYSIQLQQLLADRDSKINALITAGKPDKQMSIFTDRSVYDLAEKSIDLLADLSIMLESDSETLLE